MARKELNKPLVVKTGAAVLLAVLAFVGISRVLGADNPEKYLRRGMALVVQGRPRDSVECFTKALSLKPTSGETLLRCGDALNKLTGEDPGFLSVARSLWEGAAALSPPSRPALDRLLSSYWEEAQLAPSGLVFQNVARTAQTILGIDSGEVRAVTLSHEANVELWLLNNSPNADDDAKAEKDAAALTALLADGPRDPDAAYCVARARIRQGLSAARAGNSAIATAKFDEASAVFDSPSRDPAKATAPAKSADAEFRAFQVDSLLIAARGSPTTQSAGSAESELTKRMVRHLSAALSLVVPHDRLFVQIRLTAAMSAQADDRAGAWRLLADVLANRPDDWQGRVSAAKFLGADPGQRNRAIELLDNPRVSKEAGPAGAVARGWQVQARIEQASLRLDAAEDSADPAERQRLQKQVREVLPGGIDPTSLSPALRVLQGRLDLLEGRTLPAVRDFRAVMQEMDQRHALADPKLTYCLAVAWLRLGQTGDARPLLEQLVEPSPDSRPPPLRVNARILLAEVLLDENAKDQARPHVEWLEKQLPDNPEVKRMRAALAAKAAAPVTDSTGSPRAGSGETPTTQTSAGADSLDPVIELRMAGEASRSGDSAGTLEHLRAAERIAPRDPRVLKELLNYFSNAKAPDQAEVYCAKLAALDADQAGGRLFRFQLALARNDLEAANSLSRELTAQYPELSKSWYAAGKIAQMQGAYGAARGAYEQALKKEPTHAGALRGMAECYIDSPYPAMALVAIKHAREMLPGDPSFFQMQLDYEAKFESAETALASRQEAARLDPDDRRNWLALCAAFIRAASYDSAPHSPNEKQALASSAQKSVNDMLAKWPNDPELRVAAASVLRVEGKPMEAVEQLRAAMRRAPDDIDVLNNLACMLLDDVSPPQPSEALGLSQRAFDLMALGHALSPAICDTRGWALIRNGRTDEGIKLLEQTAAKTPSAAIRYHLAEAYLQKSLPNEAQAQLAGAMELVEEARKQGRPADAEFISQVNSATTRAAVLARHSLPR